MNKIALNTVPLDGGDVIIKKGSGGGGGVTINNQEKSVDITENGTTEVVADTGFTGLSKVGINVAIPTEEKTIEITENGTTEVVAANGFLSKVSVNVNVPTSGGGEAPSYKNGVYVQHIDRKLYTEEEWTAAGFANDAANGIAVVTDNARFVIAKNDLGTMAWSSNTSTAVNGIMLTEDETTAKTDFAGYNNTQLMLATDTSGAGYSCANFTFPNGDKGYLPALGELNEAYANKSKIESLMTKIGGTKLTSGVYYRSSTQRDSSKAWILGWNSGSSTSSDKDATYNYVRAFTSLDLPSSDVPSSGGKPKWTGHADVEGLKAIGWTDEDIAYYQENGVNWNAEDDEYHKVTDDNKALYGVLTANNISSYKDRIVYLPKIDTSGKTTMNNMFYDCRSLVSIPQLDTQKVTNMSNMFQNCYSLVSIPQLDTANVTNMYYMFSSCRSLVSIPQLDTQKVTNMNYMFSGCYSLVNIPQLDTQKVTNMNYMFSSCYSLVSIPQLDTQSVTGMNNMFYDCYSLVNIPQLDTQSVTGMNNMFQDCYSLVSIPQLDTQSVTEMNYMFYDCRSLTHANLKNAKLACDLSRANLLSKESLLYIINNEAATTAITIKLASYAYTRLAEDADVVAALANHPNISISK